MAEEPNWGDVEQQLKQKAGQWYDPSMLQDVQRNSSYGAGGGASNVGDWVNRVSNKAQLRGSNEVNSTYQANGQGGVTVGPTGRVNDPNGTGGGGGYMTQSAPAAPSVDMSQTNDLIKQMMDRQAAQDAQNRERGDNLFKMYTDRANQSLAINRNDPIIRAQADAFSANQDRAARNANSDAAERGGQFANLEGVRRMNAEHAGQASGAFEASLMGQELTARRNEIAQALAGQGGLLTADQQNQLQRQLALLDHSIQQQQIGLGQQGVNLQSKSLGQDWQKALLANEQNNNRLGFDYADLYSRNYNNNAQY